MNAPTASFPVPSYLESPKEEVSATGAIGVTQRYIEYPDMSGGAITTTLPPAAEAAGLLFFFFLSDAAPANAATITAASTDPFFPNFIGATDNTSIALNEAKEWALLYSTGRYWVLVNSYEVP